MKRAQSKSDEDIRVSVAVLGAQESRELFGVDLADDGIQPVWLKVENHDDVPYWFLLPGLDPQYFSPLESSYANHSGFKKSARRQMDYYFDDLAFKNPIHPNAAVSGFVYVNLNEGVKAIDVDLYSPTEVKNFTFFVLVPGFKGTAQAVDLKGLYSKEDFIDYDNFDDLRRALEGLLCCTTNAEGTKKGDPLNLIFIGTLENVVAAFVRRGWHPTEVMHVGSMRRTVKSFLTGSCKWCQTLNCELTLQSVSNIGQWGFQDLTPFLLHFADSSGRRFMISWDG